MDCEVIKEIIPAYIDHSASEEEIKIVEEHLCVCNDCRQHLGQCMEILKPVPKETKPQESINSTQAKPKSDDIFNYAVVGVAVLIMIFFAFLFLKK